MNSQIASIPPGMRQAQKWQIPPELQTVVQPTARITSTMLVNVAI